MEAKDTLFHIEWGDGDDTFVLAPDKATAIERMPDGKDMVNSVVKLDALYGMIYRAGRREVVECLVNDFHFSPEPGCEHDKMWQAQLKEWDIDLFEADIATL